jgi:replicative DNA helicase Mcm
MEAQEQIEKYREFIEKNYLAALTANLRKDNKFLVIDFNELSKFNPELAEMLLESPEDSIKAAELSIEHFDIENAENVRVRFKNLPESQILLVRNIRSRHLNKLFQMEGIVRQKSDVRPQVTAAKFECPSCGNVINVLQLDASFKEPSRCGCGRKGKFHLISKELVDAQGLVLEEDPENLEGGEQPKRINVFLKDDLVSPISERRTSPGSKIRVTGLIKEIPIILRTGSKSTRFDLLIEANYVEAIEESFFDVEISDEEERQIRELSEDPKMHDKLKGAVAPSIFGHDKIKEAILLQMVGGVHKTRKDGVMSRGDMHVLLIGDPGSGKSALLKRANIIAPKARYVSGKGVSGAGLTAAVVKDEFLKGWSLEAGAMVLASNGLCCIDEMDKISPEDRAAMHEAMENQTVSISKANIQATLLARTTVLAAANPKFGRFDPYGIIADQIDLPPTLINRFDLIFTIKDLPDEKKDKQLASHILHLHQSPQEQEQEIDTDFLKKYIGYAKRKIRPKLSDGALEEIEKYYLKMRASGGGEEGIRTIPISPRQLEALVRLTEANARLRMSMEATRKDAKKGIALLEYSLREVGFDKETGKIDIDRIATGVSASARSHILIIKEIINELESKIGKTIPIDDVVASAKERGIEEEKVEEALEKLKRTGDVFEPRHGFVSKI